jgi:K+-sensing histidine kinase KdpD
VAILIEKVKHPDISDDELSRRLKKQKVFVEGELIHDFFVRHNLAVKKTLRSI